MILRHFIPLAFAVTSISALAAPSCQKDGDLRSCHDSSEQAPRYILFDQGTKWSSGVVPWWYNPAGQPSWIDTSAMLDLIQESMTKWQSACNIRFEYKGTTQAPPDHSSSEYVIGWGYANGYAGYTTYWRDHLYQFIDVDIVLDPNMVSIPGHLQGLVNHELGHAIGLDHSDVNESIMFANPYHTYTYQQTLRSDDVAGCIALYGPPITIQPPIQNTPDRIFNWAEATFSQFFPGPVATTTLDGGYLRYYASTGLYLIEYFGRIYIHGGPYYLLDVGSTDDFLSVASDSGY
jgi:hypothetical protein